MTVTLHLLVVLFPLVSAAFATWRHASWLPITAPLPAIALLAVTLSPQIITLEWVLFGVRLGLDDTGRMFLLASALVWILAALYAAGSLRRSSYAPRFRLFFLLAMAGNFALILAQDVVTFFMGFTLMGLSAYGLVVHQGSALAQRAGRLYLSWTIVGEMILFCAMVVIATQSGGVDFAGLHMMIPSHLLVALVVTGFGIKLALPGLHVWLPTTYAVAPAAGVAVLSGPMISAGLLGWIRFMPPGNEALIPWGAFLIALGMVGAAYGVFAGLLQKHPKFVLGYSSISKMGVVTSGFGIALAHPDTAPLLLAALTLYAVHHMIVKSALFIGIDLLKSAKVKAWVMPGLVILGLALAGAPFTSGALAKARLIADLPESMTWFVWWLTLTAFGSILLLGRLLYLLLDARKTVRAIDTFALISWEALILLVIMLPFFVGTPQELVSGSMPIALGALVILLVWLYQPTWLNAMVGWVPPGDILHLARRGAQLTRNAYLHSSVKMSGDRVQIRQDHFWQSIIARKSRLLMLPMASPKLALVGALWIIIVGLVFLAIKNL